MRDTPTKLAAAIMRHYGAEAQKDILIEEMADVQIMLWQFASLMNGYWREEYERAMVRKLTRQMGRIEEERV